MFKKLGRDEVLTALHMHLGAATQGRIQGRAPFFKKLQDCKATATNRMYCNDLEACRMKCCYFWFHSKISLAFIVLS